MYRPTEKLFDNHRIEGYTPERIADEIAKEVSSHFASGHGRRRVLGRMPRSAQVFSLSGGSHSSCADGGIERGTPFVGISRPAMDFLLSSNWRFFKWT